MGEDDIKRLVARADAADKRMQHLQEQIDSLKRTLEGLIAGLPDAVRDDLRRRGV